jgi:hypothetical protein
MTRQYQLTCITRHSVKGTEICNLAETAELSGIHPEMIEEFIRGHLVQAFEKSRGEFYFDESAISRLRHLAYLRDHDHTSLRTLRYIGNLLDHIETKERQIHELRERMR